MGNRRLKVRVSKGLFPSERTVTIEAGTERYTLVVDEQDVLGGDWIEVFVVAVSNGRAIVDLPRETFTSGARVSVPTQILAPA